MARWLDDFEGSVRAEDVERGRAMFNDDVVAYGTRTAVMTSLTTLVRDQWTPVWTSTAGFTITDVDQVLDLGDGWVVAARWESRSRARGHLRTGRCTLVLAGQPLQCAHSHFSSTPTDAGNL